MACDSRHHTLTHFIKSHIKENEWISDSRQGHPNIHILLKSVASVKITTFLYLIYLMAVIFQQVCDFSGLELKYKDPWLL